MPNYLVSAVLDQRPAYEEYPGFYHKYVDSLTDGNIFQTLEDQLTELENRVAKLAPEKWSHRYAGGKWSVKEVLGHMIDAERVFSFRALCFARGDKNELPGFDENTYVEEGDFDKVSEKELLRHLICIRRANVLLYSTFGDKELDRTGKANGSQISVRALVFITAGHFQHHLNILKERYGV